MKTAHTLAGIVAGDIYGTVVQRPLRDRLQAVVSMDRYLRGDKKQLADGKILILVGPSPRRMSHTFRKNVRTC